MIQEEFFNGHFCNDCFKTQPSIANIRVFASEFLGHFTEHLNAGNVMLLRVRNPRTEAGIEEMYWGSSGRAKSMEGRSKYDS